MGLDVEMFAEAVPKELLCAVCKRVLEEPKMSTCHHIFCHSCLHTHVTMACPICGKWLQMTSFAVPAQLCKRLLDLKIQCDRKCGQTIGLGKLASHVADECPNSVMNCQYWDAGCRQRLRRRQVAAHEADCEFRPVVCEACGHKTVARDLLTHQSRKKCVELRVKHQLIQAVRTNRKEVKRHQKILDRQQIRVEQHNRRTELDHFRRMNANLHHRHRQQNSKVFSEDNCTNKTTNSISRSIVNKRGQVPPPLAQRLSVSREASDGGLFLTAASFEESSEGPRTPNTPGYRQYSGVQNCRNCRKPFDESGNKSTSCRWHAGPIIDLFGGTCYTCGRLDYQNGCMMGFHEI